MLQDVVLSLFKHHVDTEIQEQVGYEIVRRLVSIVGYEIGKYRCLRDW